MFLPTPQILPELTDFSHYSFESLENTSESDSTLPRYERSVIKDPLPLIQNTKNVKELGRINNTVPKNDYRDYDTDSQL